MANSAAFDAARSELERSASMDQWAARGALQLALMDAGLDAGSVSASQLSIVVERLLPRQLQSHGGVDVSAVCSRLRDVLAMMPAETGEAADEVVSRLAR